MSLFQDAALVLPGPHSRPRACPRPADAADVAQALLIARAATASSTAHLVLLADKQLLFSGNRRAFIMYGITRGGWIAMGDPVGPAEEHPELIARFVAACDRTARRPAFYRVDAAHLPLYAAAGLCPIKLGEEAVVGLGTAAGLRGGRLANLRQTSARAARAGCTFELVHSGDLAGPDGRGPVLPQLMAVSDAWLATKSTREKCFSGGRCSAAYLRHFSVAIVRRHGIAIAFASLWPDANATALTVDLMRHCPQAPYGTMDFLFARLLGWAAAQGYRQINLGMAPLSGYGPGDLPAVWRALAGVVVAHAGHFYGFKGLRRFKEKFAPDWQPRYLACRPGLPAAATVAEVTLLVAGGWRGLLGK